MRISIWLVTAMVLAALPQGVPAAKGSGESDFVKATRARLVQELPANVAKLRAELKENRLSEFTVKDVGYTLDPRAVEPLLEVLRAPGELSLNVYVNRRGAGDAHYIFAAEFLGRIGDRRAVPALESLLTERMQGDAFPDSMRVSEYVTGRMFNRLRRDEALEAAIALFRLGELRVALEGLRYIVQKQYDPGTRPTNVPTHLWYAVELPLAAYSGNKAAMDTIVSYLRECTRSPNEAVRAAAALQIVEFDRVLAQETAVGVIRAGLDDRLLPCSYLTHPKRDAIEALLKIGGAQATAVLRKAAASSSSAWLRAEAKIALVNAEGER